MTRPVAVIPAAGLGTRMRPATTAVPKELLPVGGRPAIDWVLDEARCAGLDRAIVVTSPAKPAIAAYLDQAARQDLYDGLAVECALQSEPRGLGDAVLVARELAGGGPLVVLLPDELMLGSLSPLSSMLAHYGPGGASVVAVLEVPRQEIGSYGCVEIAGRGDGGVLRVASCVEKPSPSTAPSNLALVGRYVLEDAVLDEIVRVLPDGRGEIQLTAALSATAAGGGLVGVELDTGVERVDVGSWLGWLEANLRAFAPDCTPFTPQIQDCVLSVR